LRLLIQRCVSDHHFDVPLELPKRSIQVPRLMYDYHLHREVGIAAFQSFVIRDIHSERSRYFFPCALPLFGHAIDYEFCGSYRVHSCQLLKQLYFGASLIRGTKISVQLSIQLIVHLRYLFRLWPILTARRRPRLAGRGT
jgi:hypothetical protein